jgi:hypothetical protein
MMLGAAATRADAAGEYKTSSRQKLRIIVDTEWISAAAPGYLPVRWDITNLGDDRIIEIVGSGTRNAATECAGSAQAVTSVRQRLQLAPAIACASRCRSRLRRHGTTCSSSIREDDRTIQTGFISSTRLGEMSALIVSAPNGAYAALAPGWLRAATYGRRFGGPPAGRSSSELAGRRR